MKKYMTSGNHRQGIFLHPEIEVCDVERETESSVWIRGRRNAKVSDWAIYHDDFEAARKYLMVSYTEKIAMLESRIATTRKELGKVIAMEKPK